MKLRKVISGGQTGADQAGLVCGMAMGLETGGWMPPGWATETGPAPTVAELFGLKEHPKAGYVGRTYQNVLDSDATVWVGTLHSPGFYCTKRACMDFRKPFIVNPSSLKDVARDYEVVNIAGNRASKNPGVVAQVEALFASLVYDEGLR